MPNIALSSAKSGARLHNALALFGAGSPISQTTPNAPSGGRVESLCKGLSGMDAARAAMGQGWPFAACPWNDDGAREPDEVGPDGRGTDLLLTFGASAKSEPL